MKRIVSGFAICLLVLFSSVLAAQPGDPGGDPDNPIPITGIEYFLIAGGVIGIRRLLKKK